MKTKGMRALTASDPYGGLFYSKIFVLSLVLALIFASFPVARVLAAPASDQGTTENINLEQGWKNKLSHLRAAGFYYDHIQFYPADFERPSDLSRVHGYLEKYGFALKQANTILFNHAGFDIEGNVTNEVQAAQSVRDLAMYLQMMRGFRDKIGEIPTGK